VWRFPLGLFNYDATTHSLQATPTTIRATPVPSSGTANTYDFENHLNPKRAAWRLITTASRSVVVDYLWLKDHSASSFFNDFTSRSKKAHCQSLGNSQTPQSSIITESGSGPEVEGSNI